MGAQLTVPAGHTEEKPWHAYTGPRAQEGTAVGWTFMAFVPFSIGPFPVFLV